MNNPFSRKQPFSLGEVEVVTGRILLIDPAWLADDLVHELTHAIEPYTMGRGIIVSVDGDGLYQIFKNPDGTLTLDT